MNQEEIREFWEAWGFRHPTKDEIRATYQCFHWKYPDDSLHSELPPIDLNSLFQYVIPQLKIEEPQILFVHGQHGYEVSIYDNDAGVHYDHTDKDPAAALFQALSKIKEE